MTLKTKEKTG